MISPTSVDDVSAADGHAHLAVARGRPGVVGGVVGRCAGLLRGPKGRGGRLAGRSRREREIEPADRGAAFALGAER